MPGANSMTILTTPTAWAGHGPATMKTPLAWQCLLSNGEDGKKHMETGSPESTYRDITEHISEQVTTNKEGWGEFLCKGGSVSVWVPVDR